MTKDAGKTKENQNEVDEVLKNKVINIIRKNYLSIENVMGEELKLSSTHNGLSGNSRETRWMDFFRKIIPRKFAMEQGVIIMDAVGRVSREVDIVVFDNQYTPYLFQYGTLKFIPIEAVAVVIECKSSDWKGLKNWYKSIENLQTTPIGIARIVQGYSIAHTLASQKSTRPIRILASIRKNPHAKTLEGADEYFDIIIYENEKYTKKEKSLQVHIPNEGKSLGWWGNHLNGTNEVGNKDCEGFIDCDACQDNEESKISNENFKGDCEDNKGNNSENPSKEGKKHNFSDKGIFFSGVDDAFKSGYEYLSFCKKNYLTNKLSEFRVEKEKQIGEEGKKDNKNQLLSLNFQLNQLLMLINNPMPFPHLAYARLLSGKENTRPRE